MHFVQAPRKEVEIINNEHVKKMLEHALENDLELLPFLVLGFFCGIRPAGELTQVLWRDVHLDGEKPEVIIRATVSKTRRMRAIELSPNAVAWLNVYRAQGGGMDGLIVKLKRYGLEGRRNVNWRAAAGKRIKWIQDGMRHTFCSNWLAFHEKIDRLVLISGHDSVDTMCSTTTKARPKRLPPPSGIFIRLQSIRKMSSDFPLPKKHQSVLRPTKPERCASLRSKGVTARKPIHELRKESGSMVNRKHGLTAAKDFLRHADIAITAAHYIDRPRQATSGLGSLLKAVDEEKIVPLAADSLGKISKPKSS